MNNGETKEHPSILKALNISAPVILIDGQRLLTFAMIDAIHNLKRGTSRRTFSKSQQYFDEGEHFRNLSREQMQKLKIHSLNPTGSILFTERGYVLLSVTFNDDLSWAIWGGMVDKWLDKESRAYPTPELDRLFRSWPTDGNVIRLN